MYQLVLRMRYILLIFILRLLFRVEAHRGFGFVEFETNEVCLKTYFF